MPKYHLRRKDKAMKSRKAMLDFLARQQTITIALSKEDEPYLFTADYGFDRKNMAIFIHCAGKGKKVDYIESNPVVWGQAMEDLGYLQGECDHKYRCVQFKGRAKLIRDLQEKRKALFAMIDHLEEDPEKGKREFIEASTLKKVLIIRIDIDEISGKESLTGSGV